MKFSSLPLLQPIKTECLLPEQYLKLTPEEKVNIESIRIIPPKLGDDHFGMVEVIYRFLFYRKLK